MQDGNRATVYFWDTCLLSTVTFKWKQKIVVDFQGAGEKRWIFTVQRYTWKQKLIPIIIMAPFIVILRSYYSEEKKEIVTSGVTSDRILFSPAHMTPAPRSLPTGLLFLWGLGLASQLRVAQQPLTKSPCHLPKWAGLGTPQAVGTVGGLHASLILPLRYVPLNKFLLSTKKKKVCHCIIRRGQAVEGKDTLLRGRTCGFHSLFRCQLAKWPWANKFI